MPTKDESSSQGILPPAHAYLLREFCARFHGPYRRRWYLSDGGHFENTGCYELIRRRVPIIVVCDCGADPTYEFEDIANLVRKARTDFNARIEFVTPAEAGECGQHAKASGLFERIGPLEALRMRKEKEKDDPPRAVRHCALAKVTYDDSPDGKPHVGSLILFLKPTVTGGEPKDILHYAATHATFPQETTADQFFDEAQWESYRMLGEHIGSSIFADGAASLDQLRARLKDLQGT